MRLIKIFGVKRAYDYVEKKMSRYQTVVTAVIANREYIIAQLIS
jgi:hypothetical protein